MAEGGRFPWKMQKVWTRGPVNDYSNLREPLPHPPEGMVWKQDSNKEWKLVKEEPDLTEENVLDGIPHGAEHHSTSSSNKEDEWELLSDRVSTGSGGAMLVKASGSVRSILSLEHHENSSQTTQLSVPFKIQRTGSNSTIDSCDNALGPSGKGVLGVDYVEHVVLPTDTLQGICLAYKISSTRLRQANHFSGHSLFLAPKKLVIPISKKALRSGFIRVQDTDAKEFKLHAFLAEFPKLSMTEAKAYLELADWVLGDAIASAREDLEWEKEMSGSDALKSGEIRITKKKGMPLSTQGAGIQPTSSRDSSSAATTSTTEEKEEEESMKPKEKVKPIKREAVPAIATKTVKAEDVYKASQQHNNFGVELQPLAPKKRGEYA